MGRRQKVTLVMQDSVVRGIREAVEAGMAKSQSGLVHDAVADYLERKRREMLAASYADAARDPVFLADVEEIRKDFEQLDREVDTP